MPFVSATVISEQPFVDLARHCNLSPTLLSHGELFEIYKVAYSTDDGSSIGLTFPGFCYAFCRCALVVFSGPQWDDVYHTSGSKMRLFLFWIEQGISSGRARSKTIGSLKFPGNAGRLWTSLKVLNLIYLGITRHSTRPRMSLCVLALHFQRDLRLVACTLRPLLFSWLLDRALQRLFHWFVCPGGAGGSASHTNPAMMTASMFEVCACLCYEIQA